MNCLTDVFVQDWASTNLVPQAGDEIMITSTTRNTYVTMTLSTWCGWGGGVETDGTACGGGGGLGMGGHPGYGRGEVFDADGNSLGDMNLHGCSNVGGCS